MIINQSRNQIISINGFTDNERKQFLFQLLIKFHNELLRYKFYHAIWSSPNMQELAEARRANGQMAGLPLPLVVSAFKSLGIMHPPQEVE